ncbi:MAG: hypothetical protein LRY35_01405, partial [Clostridiales bacterium]|nr:hypothetical protein [Clostridiales bacterium]
FWRFLIWSNRISVTKISSDRIKTMQENDPMDHDQPSKKMTVQPSKRDAHTHPAGIVVQTIAGRYFFHDAG